MILDTLIYRYDKALEWAVILMGHASWRQLFSHGYFYPTVRKHWDRNNVPIGLPWNTPPPTKPVAI